MNFTQSKQYYFDPNTGNSYQPGVNHERRTESPAMSEQRRPQVRQPAGDRNTTPRMPHDRLDPRVAQVQMEFDDVTNHFVSDVPAIGTADRYVPDTTSAPSNAYEPFHSRMARGLIVAPSREKQAERCRQIAHLMREQVFNEQRGNEFPVPRRLCDLNDALGYLNTTLLPPSLSKPPRTHRRSNYTRSTPSLAATREHFNADDPASYQTRDSFFPASPAAAVPEQRSMKRKWVAENDERDFTTVNHAEPSDVADDLSRHATPRHYPDGRLAPQREGRAAARENITRKV